MGKWRFFEEFNLQKNCGINSAHQKVFGASWNDIWLVYASFTLREWQAVKMTLLAFRFLIPPQPLFMDARIFERHSFSTKDFWSSKLQISGKEQNIHMEFHIGSMQFILLTALFNNAWTLNFKSQLTIILLCFLPLSIIIYYNNKQLTSKLRKLIKGIQIHQLQMTNYDLLNSLKQRSVFLEVR